MYLSIVRLIRTRFDYFCFNFDFNCFLLIVTLILTAVDGFEGLNIYAEVGRSGCMEITSEANSAANERKLRQYTGATGAPSMLIVITRIRCGKRSSSYLIAVIRPPTFSLSLSPSLSHLREAAFHRRDMTRIPEGSSRLQVAS